MTTFKKTDLLGVLDIVSPALASSEMVPQLNCFWFTSKYVMAYNDLIAIRVPCKTDFSGAVHGKALLGAVRPFDAKEVELTAADDVLTIKMGAYKTQLDLRPPEDFVFKMPDLPANTPAIKNPKAFFDGLANCIRSIGSNSYDSDQLGITVIPNGKGVELFATNGVTLSKAVVKSSVDCPRRIILPEAFCREALKYKDADQVLFAVGEDYALMWVGSRTLIFGKLLKTDKPYDFPGVIAHHLPKKALDKSADIPKKLRGLLESMTAYIQKEPVQLSVAQGKLRVACGSNIGKGALGMSFSQEQDGVSCTFDPAMLLAGVDSFKQLLLTDGCCVMSNPDGSMYLVARKRPSA